MNDKEILQAFSEGDTRAFEIIYDRFYASVFFIARKYFHTEAAAKDIRSDAFIKLWQLRNRLAFDNMKTVYGWLRTITVNNCIDVLRKSSRKRENLVDIEYLIDENLLEIPDIKEVYEVSDKEAVIIERLLKRLDSLPKKFSEIFRMRCFEEMKFTEISKLLHADVSTVKKRYARAVQLLKKQ